jgi:ubiquinone/menaquinone biosynthesis C-methylase UbiE
MNADELLDKIFKKSMKRAAIAGAYLVEMRDVIYELYRVLRKGGYLVMIAANNKICGSDFKTQEYLRSIAREVGLNEVLLLIDDIKSRGLMTKRNSTASVISCEWVMVFRKD